MRCSGEPHGRNVETDPAWLKLIEARSHINFFILWVDKAGRVPTMTFSADIFCSKTASLAMAVQHKDSVALDIDSTVPGYFHWSMLVLLCVILTTNWDIYQITVETPCTCLQHGWYKTPSSCKRLFDAWCTSFISALQQSHWFKLKILHQTLLAHLHLQSSNSESWMINKSLLMFATAVVREANKDAASEAAANENEPEQCLSCISWLLWICMPWQTNNHTSHSLHSDETDPLLDSETSSKTHTSQSPQTGYWARFLSKHGRAVHSCFQAVTWYRVHDGWRHLCLGYQVTHGNMDVLHQGTDLWWHGLQSVACVPPLPFNFNCSKSRIKLGAAEGTL